MSAGSASLPQHLEAILGNLTAICHGNTVNFKLDFSEAVHSARWCLGKERIVQLGSVFAK